MSPLPLFVSMALSCLALGLPPARSATVLEAYVAPDGNDQNPGSKEKPFATLIRARDATRQAQPGQPKRIIVRGGHFYNVHLLLEPPDSGLYITAAPGERPLLFGGQSLTQWRPEGEHWQASDLPSFPGIPGIPPEETEPGQWQIRMLEVDGQWMPPARFPAKDFLAHASDFAVPWMSTTGGGWKRQPTPDELTQLRYPPGQLGDWLSLSNAEITVYHMWDESRVGLAAHDPAARLLRLNPEPGHPPGAFGVKKYVLWNLREGMTEPGQWYHDRASNRLVYWPKPGQDMAKVPVIAPTRQTIIRLQGRPDAKVKTITLKGLSLAVTTAPLQTGGFAADRFDGAITLAYTEQCSLLGLKINRVAGHGILARTPDFGTRVQDCEINDCGAGGIYVGGTNCVIYNNHVHGIGRIYPSAIGIYHGGRRDRVAHNEIHDCSYSAINYGGEGNVIENNLIYDCMNVLHDGAAIYLFAGRNCLVRRNLARDIVDAGGYGASAYYLDERCQGCRVEENIAWRVGWPSHNHMATNNVIRNNFFLVPGDAKWTFPRSAGFTVEKNILLATGTIRIENPAAVTNWSGNLFFSANDKIEWITLRDYTQRRSQTKPPSGVTIVDPEIPNWEQGRFDLAPNSPALKLGIRPLSGFKPGRLQSSASR